MILTGPEIVRERAAGRIRISPFDPAHVNPNSYNYRLAPALRRVRSADDAGEPIDIPGTGLVLEARTLYLGSTVETLGSERYVTSLIGRSSLGRLGLFLQISANIGHLGAAHKWTLELRACRPILVYPNMIIGQVTFWEIAGDPMSYEGYYGRFDHPTPWRGRT